MTITVEVTQADIDRAIKEDLDRRFHCLYAPISTSCPIAQALKRQFPNKLVSVLSLEMRIGDTYYRVLFSDLNAVRGVTSRSPYQWRACTPITFRLTPI